MANRLLLIYVAAASTFIAGALHLALIPMFFTLTPFDVTIFFLVSGIAQVFWVIPILRRWSNLWYYVGIGGTTVLIALFVIAVPGRGLQVSEFEIIIELVQIVFIVSSIMIVREKTLKTKLTSARESWSTDMMVFYNFFTLFSVLYQSICDTDWETHYYVNLP